MRVNRIEFVGATVYGPKVRPCQGYMPKDWPGWTVVVDGMSVVLEGSDGGKRRRIEIPRDLCVLYFAEEDETKAPPVPAARMPKAARTAKSNGGEA